MGWVETTNQAGYITGFSDGPCLVNPRRVGVEVMKSVKPDLSDAQMQEIFASALGLRRFVFCFFFRAFIRKPEGSELKKSQKSPVQHRLRLENPA